MNTVDTQKQEILDYVQSHPAGKVKLAVSDIDGVLRGKVIHRDKFLSVLKGGFGFCDVIFGWDIADVVYDNAKITGWHTGFPDAQAAIDLSTFRKIPWEGDLPFFLADFRNEQNEALSACPRNLLKKIKSEAQTLGFQPLFSQEFEWFNFAETPESLQEKNFKDLKPMTPGMFGYSILRSSYRQTFFNELFDLLAKFDVPLEGLHTETGPGVYEAAIMYDDILESADRAVLFKTAAKEIAYRNEVIASFMAKWDVSLPGSSGHVHQSLWDSAKENNLFYDEKDPHHMSETMQQYVAGQLYCLPYILPMVAPTINSFKRLVEGAWAPTTLTWAPDNRTTALRVLTGGAKSARLESRVCGSDTNPYLAMAACLASGLYGIKNKLKLSQPPTVGNGYEDFAHGTLPKDLNEATKAMKESAIAKELFGENFTDHFIRSREWEWRQYDEAVKTKSNQEISLWEFQRYFEIV